MKIFSIISVCLIVFTSALKLSYSQELPVSREFKAAIIKGTRTMEGVPGEKYWTNSADYKMSVEVEFINDTTWIKGVAEIKYHNNSPDKLNMLVFRSYHDIFGDGSLKNFYMGPNTELDMVSYNSMIVNGDTIPSDIVHANRSSTNLMVDLKEPLEPGESVDIAVSWKYYMHPYINIRQGVYENKSLFIAYWYPQIAVYDDIHGWDMIDYMGMAEFYNGFNNYDVDITLPVNYLVWAGGELLNPEDVYSETILVKLNKALVSDEIINIIKEGDLTISNQDEDKLTWRFKARGTPDFTFAASKHHLWDASSLEVEPGRRVLISAVYPGDSKYYNQAAEISRESIRRLSFKRPGVAYPWPQMTVFNCMQGGGGMESPMMVNNGEQETLALAAEIIHHEIAHSYFPFITGANERRHAWLDEGWATQEGMEWHEDNPSAGRMMSQMVYPAVSGTLNDLPLITPTYQITDPSVARYISYGKASMALMTIENEIGREKMNLIWKTMVERWAGKHPQPWDFFAIVNEIAGENINWLLEPLFFGYEYSDLALVDVDSEKGIFSVKNIGKLPVPVVATIHFEGDQETQVIKRSPSVWRDSDHLQLETRRGQKIKSVTVNTSKYFDTDISNNSWKK